MKRMVAGLIAVVMALLFCAPGISGAGEVDILIDKLVEKGILTDGDAREILQEVKTAAAEEQQQIVQQTATALREEGLVSAADIPAWIRDTSLKGDFRLRYQINDRHGTPDRHRGRYRLRLGFVTPISDHIDVGFGIATGSDDPRSTNQSMTDSFETPDLRLDYAYAAYRPFDWLTLLGGKFANPLWMEKYFLWDPDMRPEGVAAIMSKQVLPALELFCVTGFWILDERSGDENDPVMAVVQPGYRVALGESAYFKNTVTLYSFDNVKGTVLDHTSDSNALDSDGMLRHDYDVYSITGELGFATPFSAVPFCALFADYANNYAVSSHDDGYLLGLRFGHRKVSRPRQWQFCASYRRLERDAWLDIFPDGDVYGGQTNIRGWQTGVQYGLLNNVQMAVNYFFTERISGKSRSEDVLQADVIFKF